MMAREVATILDFIFIFLGPLTSPQKKKGKTNPSKRFYISPFINSLCSSLDYSKCLISGRLNSLIHFEVC
jgi:hypothetical protein